MDKCQFCGQERGPEHGGEDLQFFGYTLPVRYCPNLPESWAATGYPEDYLIVFEVGTGNRQVTAHPCPSLPVPGR